MIEEALEWDGIDRHVTVCFIGNSFSVHFNQPTVSEYQIVN